MMPPRTELQLQHDDYEAKLKTVQVDISKRSADIDSERSRIANTVGDYESRVNELQVALVASEHTRRDLEAEYGVKLQTSEENLQARLVELDYERQRSVELQAKVDNLTAELAAGTMVTADAVKVGIYDTDATLAGEVVVAAAVVAGCERR